MVSGFSESIIDIDGIGFSKFWKLRRCMGSGLDYEVSKFLRIPKSPLSKYTLVGDFFHELMELNPFKIKNSEVDQVIETIIEKYDLLVKKEPKLSGMKFFGDWDEVNKSCDYFYTQYDLLINTPRSKGSGSVFFEETLYSSSRELKGKPDLIIKSNESIILIEYKSGAIRAEDGEVKGDFNAQVHFYSYLIKETSGKWPDKVFIKNLSGDECEVSISKDYAIKLTDEAKGIYQFIKSSIVDISDCFEKTTASADNCRYCRLRPVCKKFESNQFDLPDFDGRYSIAGEVKSLSNNGQRVTVEVSTSRGGSFKISNILPQYIEEKVSVGESIRLLNLRQGSGEECLEGTRETEVWIQK